MGEVVRCREKRSERVDWWLEEEVERLEEEVERLKEEDERLEEKDERLEEKDERLEEKDERLEEKDKRLELQGSGGVGQAGGSVKDGMRVSLEIVG